MSDRNFVSLWFFICGAAALYGIDLYLDLKSWMGAAALIVSWLISKGIYKFLFSRSF